MNKKYQAGMGTMTLLVYLCFAGIVLLCSAKIVPALYDDRVLVSKALESLAKEPELQSMTKTEIKSKIDKFFSMNGIRGEATKGIKVVRYGEGMLVNIKYEVRNNLFKNIDVVMQFEHQLNTATKECCEYLVEDNEPE